MVPDSETFSQQPSQSGLDRLLAMISAVFCGAHVPSSRLDTERPIEPNTRTAEPCIPDAVAFSNGRHASFAWRNDWRKSGVEKPEKTRILGANKH